MAHRSADRAELPAEKVFLLGRVQTVRGGGVVYAWDFEAVGHSVVSVANVSLCEMVGGRKGRCVPKVRKALLSGFILVSNPRSL